MISPAILAALCIAQTPDFGAAIRLETSAGKIPVSPDSPSRTIVTFEAQPAANFFLTDGGHQLTITYEPRIFFRLPNDLDRPLALHRGIATYRLPIDDTFTLNSGIDASYGEVDYGRASLLFDATGIDAASVIPADAVVRTTNGTAFTTLSQWLGGDNRIAYDLRATYVRPESGDLLFPRQIFVTGDIAWTNFLTALDQIELELNGNAIDFSTGTSTSVAATRPDTRLYTMRGTATWIRTLARGYTLTLGGGVATELTSKTFVPVLSGGLSMALLQRHDYRFSMSIDAGLEGFANPILASFEPRVFAALGFTFTIMPDVAIVFSGSLQTPLGERPEDSTSVQFAETVLTGRLPITYQISRAIRLEAGARGSTRGPRFSSPDFRFGQEELVGYVSINASIDTQVPAATRSPGESTAISR